MQDAMLIDVRHRDEWVSGHIAGTVNLKLQELKEAMANLPRERRVIVVCGTAYRAGIAASLLAGLGFNDVSSLGGGMDAWSRRGLPVIVGVHAH